MNRNVILDFKKIFICVFIFSMISAALNPLYLKAEEADILAKKNDFDNLPQRPSLAVKKVPQLRKEDFLLLDSDETSRRSFFSRAAFIGDSLTQGLTMLPHFSQVPFLAELGFTLAKAAEAVKYWQPGDIDVIYILLGTNDMNYYYINTYTYVEDYALLLDNLEIYFPDVQIVVQGIFPVSNSYYNPSINNTKIYEFNTALKNLVETRDLIFVNIGELFSLDDGSLDPDLTFDGLHIYLKCYGAWLGKLQYAYEYS